MHPQYIEVIRSINAIRRRGGDVELIGSGRIEVLEKVGIDDVRVYESVQGFATITVPMPQPKGQSGDIVARAEYECLGPIPLTDKDAVHAAAVLAYWTAIENLKVEFAAGLKATRVGIKQKRIDNLLKSWITPLTKEHLRGVKNDMASKGPTWAVQVRISYKGRYVEERVYESIEASTANLADQYACGLTEQYLEELCQTHNRKFDDYVIHIGYKIPSNLPGGTTNLKTKPKKRKGVWDKIIDVVDGVWEEVDTPPKALPPPRVVPPPANTPVIKPFHCPIHELCADTVPLAAASLQVEL